MDIAPLMDKLDGERVARLATADPTGVPHVVPICFGIEGDTLYFAIDQKPKSGRPLRRLLNIEANPRVSVLFDHYEEDWSRLWWVRFDGLARVLEAGAEADRALDVLVRRYPQYRSAPPPGPVVAIDVTGHSQWTGGAG